MTTVQAGLPPASALRMVEQHVRLLGADLTARIEATDELPGTVNIFKGKDTSRWIRDLKRYAQLRYKDIYPGIDLVFYGKGEQLEYDFVVAPGADPKVIRMQVDGTAPIKITQRGELQVGDAVHRPQLYQNLGNGKRMVEGRFVALDSGAVGFQFKDYDPNRPLIIDPAISLSYSTYLGGRHYDEVFNMALDSNGNAYLTGWSASEDFPVSSNALQSARQNLGQYSYDTIVTKFDSSGTLVYSTFLGGSQDDQGDAIAVDGAGEVYVGGYTQSTDFPITQNAFQASNGGSKDAFLVKLSSDGSKLLYSTYLGGSGDEYIGSLLYNQDGSLWMVGGASASGLPSSVSAFQPKPYGTDNYYVAKGTFSQDGALQLPYLTFIGGSNSDEKAHWGALAVDPSGNVYLAGSTQSSDYPVSANAFQKPSTLSDGCNTNKPVPNSLAVLTKFSPDLSQMLYSTVLGGTSAGTYAGAPILFGSACDQNALSVHLDAQGNIWLTGHTPTTNFPVTSNAIQSQVGFDGSDFIVELSADGTKELYGTYFGDYADLGGESYKDCNPESDHCDQYYGGRAAWDPSGHIWLAGVTRDSATINGFPVTSDALQTKYGGGLEDFTLTEFSSDGTTMLYSTLFGASGNEGLNGGTTVAIDSNGNVHLAGTTTSIDFPVTQNAYQSKLANGNSTYDGSDIIYTVISAGTSGNTVQIVGPESGGNTGDVTITLSGSGLTSGATCKLILNGTTISGSSAAVNSAGTSISCTFPLTGVAAGSYSVVVTNPDGTTFTSASTYTIENGGAPDVWVNIVGRTTVRQGTPTTFNVTLGNSGSVDALGVVVAYSYPSDATYKAQYSTSIPTSALPGGIDYTTLPASATVNGITTVMLYYPVIHAGESLELPYQISEPSSDSEFTLSAYAWRPFASSQASFDAAFAAARSNSLTKRLRAMDSIVPQDVSDDLNPDKAAACIQDLAQTAITALGFNAAAGCIGSGANLLVSLKGLVDSDGSTVGYALGGVMVGVAQTALECSSYYIPGGQAVAVTAGLIQAAMQAGQTYTDCAPVASGLYNAALKITNKNSIDPNYKSGPTGDGSASQFVRGVNPIPYSIGFENEPTASLPAAKVVITDQLDPVKLDLTTLTLQSIQLGSNIITLPASVNSYDTIFPINSSLSVSIKGGLDASTGMLKWTFQSIDPATGLPPTDPTIGFLPPDTDGVKGQGSVLFNVRPKSGQATGTQITNGASVVFDANAAIATQNWTNTLDVDAPTSKVASLPAQENVSGKTGSFTVNWSGTDKGSGISNFNVYVSDNGGAFSLWQSAVSGTSASFTGTVGHTYGFYSMATDAVGNVEVGKTVAEATTSLVNLQPTTTTLTASVTSVTVGTPLNLSAAILLASGNGTPTGSVAFLDGATQVGTAALDSSGKASLSTSALAVGTHSLTAAYGGDSTYAASTSTAITITVNAIPADFSISLNPANGTVKRGNSASTTITLTPQGGFNQQVSFACSGLPQYSACTFAPASITPNGSNSETSKLTITTDVKAASLQSRPLDTGRGTTAWAFLAGGVLLGFAGFRRHGRSFSIYLSAIALVTLAAIVGIAGCGSAGPTTPRGSSSVTITATSGDLKHSATFTLDVQ